MVRVVHLGASMIGADDLPAILRAKFQTRFGDGGAGLVLLHRYMANYPPGIKPNINSSRVGPAARPNP